MSTGLPRFPSTVHVIGFRPAGITYPRMVRVRRIRCNPEGVFVFELMVRSDGDDPESLGGLGARSVGGLDGDDGLPRPTRRCERPGVLQVRAPLTGEPTSPGDRSVQGGQRRSSTTRTCRVTARRRPDAPGHLKRHVQHADHLHMRRAVAGGLGVAALAWALGSSDWRSHWSEFWALARTQIGATDVVRRDHRSLTVGSVRTERESASLP